jgi:asparagine synthase (glutamine-hydrolysing)
MGFKFGCGSDDEIIQIISLLKKKLIESIQRNRACGLLFSGGVDTAILASINPATKAITVTLNSYGEDYRYATSVARFLNIEHYQKRVEPNDAINSIPEVIKILRTFDLAIPNDVVVYFGLKLAREMGINDVMTGDGADELFAGYEFMKSIEDLDKYIKRIASSMSFSSNTFGDFWGIKIKQPYLDNEFIRFALDIPIELKIREENKKLWCKWILRKAFDSELPSEIVWQNKRPLEYGSGMRKLREIITSKISDEEFRKKSKIYPVKFVNKEHLYYYEIYRDVIGDIPKPKEDEKACPYCSGGMDIFSFHCKICGCVLNWRS